MKNTHKKITFRLILWILSGIFLLYMIYPLVNIISFIEPGGIVASITRPSVIHAFILSVITASISTILICLFGIPLAYCLSRYSFPGSFLIQIIVIIPLVMPPLASGALLLGMFSSQSNLNVIFPNIEFTQSILGIIIAQTYVASPFMILTSMAAFDMVDRSYENIAHVLGKRSWQVFLKISLPLAKKGILIGFVMTWVRAIGELGATLMLAYNPHTISIQIYEDNAIGGLSQAIPTIILSILISVILILVYSIITKSYSSRGNSYGVFGFGKIGNKI